MTYGQTDIRTDRLTGVGARDTCACLKTESVNKILHFETLTTGVLFAVTAELTLGISIW